MNIRPPRVSGRPERATRGLNAAARGVLTASVGVRALAERVLQDTTEDLRVQCSRVDQAFSHRCVELAEAKTQLETKLAQVDGRWTKYLYYA